MRYENLDVKTKIDEQMAKLNICKAVMHKNITLEKWNFNWKIYQWTSEECSMLVMPSTELNAIKCLTASEFWDVINPLFFLI